MNVVKISFTRECERKIKSLNILDAGGNSKQGINGEGPNSVPAE